jgi:hypothetical protein
MPTIARTEKLIQTVLMRLEQSTNSDDLALLEIVGRAKINDHWGYDENVQTGSYDSTSQFYTLLLHEAAHGVLGVGSSWEDEERCHKYSQTTCKRLGFPFSARLVRSCRMFGQLSADNDDQDLFSHKVGELIPRNHRKILRIEIHPPND